MNLKARFAFLGAVLACGLALAGCGGGGGGGGGGGPNQEIATNGDQLAFDKTSLTVPANQEVTITFTNKSTALQHNWVLVKGGADVAAQVNQAGLNDTTDYVPNDDPNVLAHTQLLNAGSNGQAKFTVPPGTYTYLCTFPGHYPSMQGTLTAQ